MFKHFYNTFDSFKEKRLINRLLQGSAYVSNRRAGGNGYAGSAPKTTTTKSTTSSPTTSSSSSGGLTFGSNLTKAISSGGAYSSPWNLSSYSGGGGGSSSGSTSSTSSGTRLNFEVPTAPPSPPTSLQTSSGALDTSKSGGLTFGSDLLKAINESKANTWDINAARSSGATLPSTGSSGGLNFSAAQTMNAPASGDMLFSTQGKVTNPLSNITPANSPWSISRAQTALGPEGIASLKTGNAFPDLNFDLYNKTMGGGQTEEEKKEEEQIPEELPIPEEIPQVPMEMETTIQNLQAEILKALAPSQDEIDLQKQLDDEIGALELGLVDVEGRPVPLASIQGHQANMERRSSIRTAPLQRRLEAMQNARYNRVAALEKSLGFAEGALTRQFQKSQADIANKQTDFANRVALVSKGLRYDPNTDEFYKDDTLTEPENAKEKLDLEKGLRGEFVKDAGDFIAIRDSYGRILTSAQDPSAAGDLSLIFNYMKMLDPGSVVRESEFANAANAAGVPDQIRALWNKLLSGQRLAVAQRSDFVDRANRLFSAQEAQHQQRIDTYSALATNAGVNPANVVIDIGLASGIGGSSTGTNPGGDYNVGGDIGVSSKGGDFGSTEEKVASIIEAIRAGYSKSQVQDYYGLSDQQYLLITQQL